MCSATRGTVRIVACVPHTAMFRMMRNDASSGTKGSRAAANALRRRLPPGWSVELRAGSNGDELLTLRASDGRRAKLTVVSRKRVLPRDVAHLLDPSGRAGERLLLAPFLSPRARECASRPS